MGYYGGDGARQVATVGRQQRLPQTQPACLSDAATGLDRLRQLGGVGVVGGAGDRGLGHLLRQARPLDTGGASHIVFVVRDDDGHSDLLFQTSDTTWQAYNQYGGNSLYVGSPGRAAPTRSATTGRSRPRGTGAEDWVFNAEYPMVRWLEPTATTSATPPASTPTAAAPSCSSTRCSCRSATTSTGRARSARTSRRRATPA